MEIYFPRNGCCGRINIVINSLCDSRGKDVDPWWKSNKTILLQYKGLSSIE